MGGEAWVWVGMSNDIQRDCVQDRFGNLAWWCCFILAILAMAAEGLKIWPIALILLGLGYGLRYLISGRSD